MYVHNHPINSQILTFWQSMAICQKCFVSFVNSLFCIAFVSTAKMQIIDTIYCVLSFFRIFISPFNQLSCLQISRNPFDIIRSGRMFSSFPSSDPPPLRANRIPPRMRAATRALQMQLHKEQGLSGWNKLDRGRSLNSLPRSRPPGYGWKPFGRSKERHLVDFFPGIFVF